MNFEKSKKRFLVEIENKKQPQNYLPKTTLFPFIHVFLTKRI